MDIEYLLWLQNFRNAINDALTPFMEWISHFAVAYLLAVPVFVYWCISKRKGLYVLASTTLCLAVNAVTKLTACIYRPWIKDVRVVPAGDAITEATGYSFPSGHTATATPIYGGLAYAFKKKMAYLDMRSSDPDNRLLPQLSGRSYAAGCSGCAHDRYRKPLRRS